MEPVKTEKSNFTYVGHGEVADLDCERHMQDDRQTVVYSVWELSPVERELIAEGANVKLGVHTDVRIPPASLRLTDEKAVL